MNCNQPLINGMVLFACLAFMVQSEAAEFDDSQIIPEVTSFVFTQNSIALTLEPERVAGPVTDYFIANRVDYEFHQISKQEFSHSIAYMTRGTRKGDPSALPMLQV